MLSKNERVSQNSRVSPSSPNDSFYSMNDAGKYSCDFGESNDDEIDLYEAYNTLAMKHSSHEEHKPLNPMSIHKMDHYMSFFICYMFLTLKVSSGSISEMFKENFRSKHPDGASKWLLLLDTKNEDSELKESVQRIIHDRSRLFKTNIFPLLKMKDTDENVDVVIRKIEEILPSKYLCENYLDFFFHFIWITRPFIDEDTFKNDIRRIINFDDITLKPKVVFTQRSDFATVATFLIILRYSSVTIAVSEDQELPSFLVPLKENPMDVEAISVAQMCLSMYKILRKSTIHMVQALLYLRVYFKDCPEDGDGMNLNQSQLLFGFIVQSAIGMGLHRDPLHYSQISNDVKESNLRRRLWFSIVSLDCETSVLSGNLSVLPNPSLIDVNPPMVTSMDSIEQAQVEVLHKSIGLQKIWQQFCNEVNKMQSKPTLYKLVGILEESRTYVEKNFPMKNMISIKGLNCGSRVFRASMFKNFKILEINLIQIALELTFYYSLCVHYEANAHLNPDLYKLFYKKCLINLATSLDITGAYLSGALNDYFKFTYTCFAVLPLLTTTTYRSSSIIMASLLRSYHAQELLKSKVYSSKSKIINEESFERLISPLCKRYEDFMYIFKKKLGTKYYSSLKIISAGKYGYVALKRNKFSIMNKIIKFLETNEKGQINYDVLLKSNKRDEIKKSFQAEKSLITVYSEWMQLSNSSKWEEYNYSTQQDDKDDLGNDNTSDSDTIVNINNSNVFMEFTQDDITEFSNILTNAFQFCTAPKNTNMRASEDLLATSSSPPYSTPSGELHDDELFGRLFHDSDFDSQISSIFKDNVLPSPDFTNDGIFSEMIDHIMGTGATIDDVFKL